MDRIVEEEEAAPSLVTIVPPVAPAPPQVFDGGFDFSQVAQFTAPAQTRQRPLSKSEAKERQKLYGKNTIVTTGNVTWYSILFSAIFHPFNVLLGILAASSAAMDDLNATTIMMVMVLVSILIRFVQEWKSARAAQNLKQFVSNTVTVFRYRDDEDESSDTTSSRASLITNESTVTDGDVYTEKILAENIVPGDWVKLAAGDLIPADLFLLEAKDLFISQSSLTGEATEVVKQVDPTAERRDGDIVLPIPQETDTVHVRHSTNSGNSCLESVTIFFRNLFGLRVEKLKDINTTIQAETDNPSLCYMGTSVVSGTGTGIVRAIGNQTYFGSMAQELGKQRSTNAFQLGVRRISWIFFLTMICLVPPIFLLQGYIHPGDGWYEAALFALAAAVGLTPEMLPMIVSATLSRGAFLLAKKKCIVKNLDAIINLGGMNVLAVDKTGTLTQNRVALIQHLDAYGNPATFPMQLAFLNSHFQTGLANLMDMAIVDYFRKKFSDRFHPSRRVPRMATKFQKLDELPFDFVRRRMSVLIQAKNDRTQNLLVTKGAVDEMLSKCSHVCIGEEFDGSSGSTQNQGILSAEELLPISRARAVEMTPDVQTHLKSLNNKLNQNGLRVIAVAYKTFPEAPPSLHVMSESQMVFAGFIAFQDPPKQSTLPAIKTLLQHNIQIKVLSGDSELICRKICEDVKLPVTGVVTSRDLDGATDEQICTLAETGTIFAKLTPLQKAKLVRALKVNGHVVGFLGDGINDANALKEADIGLSVDNGTEIARDSADIILLEKSLTVVADGVIYGRQTYGNTLKYIVMAISSNFGNAFSLLVASAWFPFTPILPLQLLTQNMLYDISQTAIPWDKMDPEFLKVPHRWSMKSVLKFMVFFGPLSSIFDITYFAYMYFLYGITGGPDDNLGLFRTTWFAIGILTQTFIVHLLRTPKIPFVQSFASVQVTVMTTLIIAIAMALPWIPYISDTLEFIHLPLDMYPFILLELVAYCVATQIMKVIYIACFKEWF